MKVFFKDIGRKRKSKLDNRAQGDIGAASSFEAVTVAQPSPTSATTKQQQPDNGAPSAERSTGTTSTSPMVSEDPWARAYDLVQERESQLMADYWKHLVSLQGDTATSADVSTPQSVESVVQRLQETREKKQWRVSLLGNDIKIREQTERLTKFLVWTDSVIKSVVSTQPYAALAWSSVSLLLSVGTLSL